MDHLGIIRGLEFHQSNGLRKGIFSLFLSLLLFYLNRIDFLRINNDVRVRCCRIDRERDPESIHVRLTETVALIEAKVFFVKTFYLSGFLQRSSNAEEIEITIDVIIFLGVVRRNDRAEFRIRA